MHKDYYTDQRIRKIKESNEHLEEVLDNNEIPEKLLEDLK